MADYRLTRHADEDLLRIFTYGLQAFGWTRTAQYRASLVGCFEMLAENPRIGRTAEAFASGARRHEHARHVVFYDEQPDGVLIIAIVHERSMRKLRDID